METVNLQERRRLNDEIERTFISVAVYARNIQTFKQTERGATLWNLYEGFFADFSLLVILTSDLPQLSGAFEQVSTVMKWLSKKGVADANDKDLLIRCNEGVAAFLAYKKVLSNQGVISLPSR